MQDCPYCHKSAMNTWQKFMHGAGRRHRRDSCGRVVAVSRLAILPFVVWLGVWLAASILGAALFPISIVEAVALFIAWGALYMFVHVRFVPLLKTS